MIGKYQDRLEDKIIKLEAELVELSVVVKWQASMLYFADQFLNDGLARSDFEKLGWFEMLCKGPRGIDNEQV